MGPVLAGRRLPAGLVRALDLVAVALLAALVAVATLTSGSELVLDARAAGVTAAGVAVALRAPFPVVVVVGAAVAAGLRATGA